MGLNFKVLKVMKSLNQIKQDISRVLPKSVKTPIKNIVLKSQELLHKDALTKEQKEFWIENGYLIFKEFYPDRVVDKFNAYLDDLWATRKENPDLPFVVDAYEHSKRQKRIRLTDAPDDVRQNHYKLYDLYMENEFVRNIALEKKLEQVLSELFNDLPVIINSINFDWGSGQDLHFDSWYMMPPKKNMLLATWVALEDVHPDSGALKYVPGSHKIPEFIFPKSGTSVASYHEMGMAKEYVREQMEKLNLKEQIFTGKKGDLFIWHSQLLHGGSEIKDPTKTRKSFVTHYWRKGDLKGATIKNDNNRQHYLIRPHHQLT